MRPWNALVLAGALLLAAPIAPLAAQAQDGNGSINAATTDPSQLVQQVAEKFLTDLSKDRAHYRQDKDALKELVDKDLLPYFDLEYSARLVLGRHARTVTAEQKQAFITAFENSMLSNYGNALVEFQPNRLKVLPSKVDPSASSTIVRSEIRRDDGSSVPVNYAMHKVGQGWKAWDVIIEGISYVKSFRDDFGAQIDQQGIDAVIKRLQSGEKPTEITKPKAGK